MDGDCRLGAGSRRLLARHSLFADGTGQVGALAEGFGRASGRPKMVPRGLRDGFEWPSREFREQWEDLGIVLEGAEDAMSGLSLRFPEFFAI